MFVSADAVVAGSCVTVISGDGGYIRRWITEMSIVNFDGVTEIVYIGNCGLSPAWCDLVLDLVTSCGVVLASVLMCRSTACELSCGGGEASR